MFLSNYLKMKKQSNKFYYWKILWYHAHSIIYSFNCVSYSSQIDNRIVYRRVNKNVKRKKERETLRLSLPFISSDPYASLLQRLLFLPFFLEEISESNPRTNPNSTALSSNYEICSVLTKDHDS